MAKLKDRIRGLFWLFYSALNFQVILLQLLVVPYRKLFQFYSKANSGFIILRHDDRPNHSKFSTTTDLAALNIQEFSKMWQISLIGARLEMFSKEFMIAICQFMDGNQAYCKKWT